MATTPIGLYSRTDQPPPELVFSSDELIVRALPGIKMQPIPGRVTEQVPLPTQVLLGTLSHYGFRVVKPIPAHIGLEGETVVASWPEVNEFGTGTHTSLACEDLGRTLAELYEALEADEPKIGPDLKRVWGVLQEHVARRR